MTQHGTVSPNKRSRRGRRRYDAEQSSGDESSSSEEEEPTPPPKPKKIKKRKKQTTTKAPVRKVTFDVDGPYTPSMKWESNWSRGVKAAFQLARKDFQNNGTPEGTKDKVKGLKAMIKHAKATDRSEMRINNLTFALEKWEVKLTE